MLPVLSLLLVVVLSMIVNRVATVALVLTGLSRESARFQARSAFTGAGFTTSESESVVNHPVRRRIVMLLMMAGNVGLASVATTLILTFANAGDKSIGWAMSMVMIVVGVGLLWLLSASKWLDRHMSRIIAAALCRWTTLDTRDYAELLHLADNYGVAEIMVQQGDSVVNQSLAEARLPDAGIMVLGIHHPGGGFTGAPKGSSRIQAGDVLIVYGRDQDVAALDMGKPKPKTEPE